MIPPPDPPCSGCLVGRPPLVCEFAGIVISGGWLNLHCNPNCTVSGSAACEWKQRQGSLPCLSSTLLTVLDVFTGIVRACCICRLRRTRGLTEQVPVLR